MNIPEAVFTTPDGAEIAHRTRAGRDPLVLLHGLGCDASMWDGVVGALPSDIGLVIPELRGHGASTLGWRAPSVDLWADDVVALLGSLGIEKPAVAGLSMGGYIALALAAVHPGRARAFAFISTTAAADDAAGKQKRAAGIATIRRQGWRAFADGLMPKLLNEKRPHFAAHRDHHLRMFERAGDTGLPSALMALAGRPNRRGVLASIGVRCLAIAGTADALIPSDRAQEFAAAIPGARAHLLDGVAHMSAMEAPREVAELLAAL
jgi:3-oxoadipate enol-lactonase